MFRSLPDDILADMSGALHKARGDQRIALSEADVSAIRAADADFVRALAGAMRAFHEAFGDVTQEDLLGLGFTAEELRLHRIAARRLLATQTLRRVA